MDWLDKSHGGGVRLACDERYIAQMQDVIASKDELRLAQLNFMHAQLIKTQVLPVRSSGVESTLQQLSSDDWEAALQALSIDSDKWKRAIAYLPGQRVYRAFDLTIIYTVSRRKNKINIFLAEFFFGPDNPVGPGYTTI